MFRATTPLQEFELPFNTQDYDIKEVVITYSQKENELLSKRIVLEKTEDDVTFVGNKISYRLTQEETLLFDVGVVLVQIRFLDGENNAVASDIFYDRMNGVLNENILGKPREPITEELTATANGEYYPSENKVGFSKVTVEVADTNGSYEEGYAQGKLDGGQLFANFVSTNEPINITAQDLQGATQIRTYAFYFDKSLNSIVLPESVKIISSSAFNYSNLVSIDIGNGVERIENAFENCRSLTNVTLGNNLKYIGNSAFYNCPALSNLTIPASITNISSLALQIGSTTNKATFTFLGTTPPTIATSTFATSYLEKIIVPKGSRETYIASTNWANFADYIVESE